MSRARYCSNKQTCHQPNASLRPTLIFSSVDEICIYCLKALQATTPPAATAPSSSQKPAPAATAPSSSQKPAPVHLKVVSSAPSAPAAPAPSSTMIQLPARPLSVIPQQKKVLASAVPPAVDGASVARAGLESIQAGSLEIRIPHRRGFFYQLNRIAARSFIGRYALAFLEAVSYCILAVGKFQIGFFLACVAFLSVMVRGLFSRRRLPRYTADAIKSLFKTLGWAWLYPLEIGRLTAIAASLLMYDFVMAPTYKTTPTSELKLAVLGASLMIGVIVVRTLMTTGRRTIEEKKPHWYADWTRSSGLSSKDVYDLNLGFEKTVADMFTEMGFHTRHVGVENAQEILGHVGSGDSGVDVMADDRSGKRLIVSCKRYGGKVGPDEIKILHMDLQKMAPLKTHRHKQVVGAIVTTVGFTAGASTLARELNIATLTIDDLRLQAERHFMA
jgi:hypothetical protein